MIDWLAGFPPVTQALLGTIFTWSITALGAALVFFFKTIKKSVLNSMLGFAAGVMIAASFWSLLAPAIEMAGNLGQNAWLTAAAGFLAGGGFLWLIDKIMPHLHGGLDRNQAEGIQTNWQRSVLLVLAITLHNIPEGLAVGVAFGAVAFHLPSASLTGAVALAIGIGLQNFPEGAAVSIPLRREGFSRTKAFLYGQASGLVEPVGGVIGALAVVSMQHMLPYALSFAAGAMIYVVVEELIPEAQRNEGGSATDIATVGCMIGFAVMMVLDVGLG
ncbi:MAG: ZIP family metal transporter [Clostridiaceae bacterium]|nr:ZIP family metal transporter [Clostridiaceae bacterium]